MNKTHAAETHGQTRKTRSTNEKHTKLKHDYDAQTQTNDMLSAGDRTANRMQQIGQYEYGKKSRLWTAPNCFCVKTPHRIFKNNAKANPKTIAILLFGAPHYWNSCVHSVGNDLGYSREKLMKDVVDSLFAGLAMPEKRNHGKVARTA